jgi:hypothetical protein
VLRDPSEDTQSVAAEPVGQGGPARDFPGRGDGPFAAAPRDPQGPTQAGVDGHVSLQMESSAHWKVQRPPRHELAQVDPDSHTKRQPPPSQEASHVAPALQSKVQPPPSQLGAQVPPAGHVMPQPPLGQAVAQGGAHSQPASGDAWLLSQTGSGEPLVVASELASVPLSGTMQSAATFASSRATVHSTSSLLATAVAQVSLEAACVQYGHSAASDAQGSREVPSPTGPEEQATVHAPAVAIHRARRLP